MDREGEVSAGIQGVEVREAAGASAMHKKIPTTKYDPAQMLLVPKLRNPVLKQTTINITKPSKIMILLPACSFPGRQKRVLLKNIKNDN